MARSTPELVAVQPNLNSVPESLTYYDPELQNAWNVEPPDTERLTRAIAKSRQLRLEYMKQLTELRPRLNRRTYARFAAERDSLFDSDLLEWTFGDRVGFAGKARSTLQRTSACATFLSFDRKTLHELRYRHVDSVYVNIPAQRWFSVGDRRQIDQLLAHELTGVRDPLMQHKFLFVSGAVISIGFAQMNWDTRRDSKH